MAHKQEGKRRRPTSYFLLLAAPLVLILGLQLVISQETPRRFVLVLACLFAFFGLAVLHALLDLLSISRQRLREERNAYRNTLGDRSFMRELGRRVNERKRH
ncbi:MAG: hypothetical protein ACLFTT_18485 [Candidatus Hydrogenedentota bacterium]